MTLLNLLAALLLHSIYFTHCIEVTTCNCDKPIFKRLFDMGEPYFCNNPVHDNVTEVLYEAISKKEALLQNTLDFSVGNGLDNKIS